MRCALTLHPNSRCDAVARIDVEVARVARGGVLLSYATYGTIRGVRLPLPAASVRTDALWRHTCFEAFLGGPDGGYVELNFSPSTEWAAYRFDGYRTGMAPADGPAPKIQAFWSDDRLDVVVALDGKLLSTQPTWRLGLSAVIEEADGRTSYWALAHPPGKPDFHHADGFALTLPQGSV